MRSTDTFLSAAEETCYADVLDERMKYNIYVHKAGFSGNFHHAIVVCDVEEKYEYVTLELGKEGRVVPRCQQFQGKKRDLNFRKEVECTFREMCQEAIEILRRMGSYLLLGNNCQNFCNHFLESMGAKKYMTTASQLGVGLAIGAVVAGFIAVGAVVLGTLFSGSGKKKNDDKDDD